MPSIVITGTGSYWPEKILTNQDLEKMVDTSDEWIRTRTGISERRIAALEQASSDLMVPAAEKALAMANRKIEEIDLIITSWSWPDAFVPGTSDIFAEKIGAPKNLLAQDFTAQCSGFVWALGWAYDKMRLYPKKYQRVLLVSGDVTTKFVDDKDRNTCPLFGDGAGALILEYLDIEGYGILGYLEASDRNFLDCLSVPAGGTAKPASYETILNREHFMRFGPKGGSPMLKAIVPIIPKLMQDLCAEIGIEPSEVDLIIPHQLNQRIIDPAKKRLKKLGIGIYDRNIARYGNCSGSSVAMALDTAYREGLIEKGDHIQLQSYGAGLKYGTVAVRWWLEKFQE